MPHKASIPVLLSFWMCFFVPFLLLLLYPLRDGETNYTQYSQYGLIIDLYRGIKYRLFYLQTNPFVLILNMELAFFTIAE